MALLAAVVTIVVAAEGIYWRKEDFIKWHLNKNRKMIKEPKLPHKLKWGDRTAARVDEVEYLIGIRVVGYTSLKDVIMEKPRAGAYYKYIKIKKHCA